MRGISGQGEARDGIKEDARGVTKSIRLVREL